MGTDVAPFDQIAGRRCARSRSSQVTAYTLKANATQDAIIGAPGELLLGRVSPAR